MNIYLVQASDNHGPNKFLPLAIGYQWCYGKNDNWTLKDVLIEKINPIDYVATMQQPKLVAMSSYVWNWEYNRELAIQIKRKFRQCKIITGGPQINKYDPDFFDKHPMFDAFVHGEGEEAFKRILAGDDWKDIPNVQTLYHMPETAVRRKNINDIPSPILEGFYEPIMAKYPEDTMFQVTWESLRGCPYHCSFCDIGESYWNKLTLFDMERCKAEIEWMGKNRIEYVSVCDSNWGMLDRDYELTQHVLETKKKYGYPKWWDATWSKNNHDKNYAIAKYAHDSGVDIFKGITVALQSFNDDTLEHVDRFNLDFDELKKYFDQYKKDGIKTYSELIWPLPGETFDSLKSGIQQLIDAGQDNYLMIHPLVVTDNSPMGNKTYQEQHGLDVRKIALDTVYLDADEKYITEYTDVIYATDTADHDTVIEGHMYSWLVILMYYYGWGHYLAKYMRKQNILETDLYYKLFEWIKHNPGLLHDEYIETKKSFEDVYAKRALWGRQAFGGDDMLWEYKGASSARISKAVYRLETDLYNFLLSTKLISEWKVRDIVALNLRMCREKDMEYPITVTVLKEVARDMVGIDADRIHIDHFDKTTPTNDWHRKAYHYQRKIGYWKCNASKSKKPLDICHK